MTVSATQAPTPTPPSARPSEVARPLPAPRAPEQPRAQGFPLVAVLAPVVGSVIIWALTRSPFALVFALLGPLVAVASVADARLQSRRLARRESARFAGEVAATRTAIDRRHARERALLLRGAPGAVGITSRASHDPERWRVSASAGVPVRLGLGSAPSSVHLDGIAVAAVRDDDPVQTTIGHLHDLASMVEGVPIVVDARLGIGVCGPVALAQAVARGILVQLGDRLAPDLGLFSAGPAALDWMESLPQRAAMTPGLSGGVIRWSCEGESGVLAVAPRVEELPRECRVVVRVVAGRRARVVRSPDDAGLDPPVDLVVELVSAEQAIHLGAFLADAAHHLSRRAPQSDRSIEQDFDSLPPPEGSFRSRGTLACVFARRADGGGMTVDLVAQGPHAIVGGTTGSGKSELLISWVLAMARSHSPSVVTFLLVDFKGGATFAALGGLPHVVGIVTDLDERTAHRAMLSLRAEIRFRERFIADAGARSVDDSGVDLPRLVIVVDEFAAMATDYPELHDLFADLAARGRSLGLHLVLCTQRPAVAIRDAVLANATLRLSLRVNNRADSLAVLGTGQAAELSGENPGCAFVSSDNGSAQEVRVARATDADIARVIAQNPPGATEIRRPWCDDLASSIPLAALERHGAGIPFAMVDLPEQQRQETARYDPSRHGSLLVIGGQGSGKSELFATLAAASGVERLPSNPDAAWDAVEAVSERVRTAAKGARLLLADDLDALIGRFGEEYQPAFVERLVGLARDGSAVGLQLGLAMRRIPPALQTLASLCDERIVLRLASRQDHLMAGGTSPGYVAHAPPGAGEWRGSRIQVARTEPAAGDGAVPGPGECSLVDFDLAGLSSVAIVTTRVTEFARRLRGIRPPLGEVVLLSSPTRAGALDVVDPRAPSILIGDPDTWQSNWALLGAARSQGLVVVDRCSVAEFRAISGRRALPPPIGPGRELCWALQPDGSVRRMRAPAA
jgi:S-DNA-T family DNA segregation ATPase FtsK/SpoIIIE